MATHSSILAWRIPWKEEPGGLQSTGSMHLPQTLSSSWLYNIQLAGGYSFCPLLMPMSEASLSPLYFNKTLLHKSSERSSLISGPGLNSSPPEAKNRGDLWFSSNLSLGKLQISLCFHFEPCDHRQVVKLSVSPHLSCVILGKLTDRSTLPLLITSA